MLKLCERNSCTKEFENKPSHKRFCSPSCKTQAKDIRLKRNQKRVNIKRRPYVIYKKAICEECGFIPIHSCQLDVDHMDGNHNNNDEFNLKTLCANCHRLKTLKSNDWLIN